MKILLLVVLSYPARVLGYSARRVRNDPSLIDALLILGTAQYNGVPSRQFAARLDHAAEIWQPGQRVFTCGGKLPGDAFTEAAVGKRYLIERGVRDDAIVAVEEGSDSWASISAVAQHNPGRVLVITDPNHSLRATSIARRLGLDARPSPTPYAPTRKIGKRWLWTVLHECSGLVVLDLRLINVRWAEWAENQLRTLAETLRPSRKARHDALRRKDT